MREHFIPINRSHELIKELCAPKFKPQSKKIVIESKDAIAKRLGIAKDMPDWNGKHYPTGV